MNPAFLETPNWRAPSTVRAFTTTRLGGVSQGPFTSMNLKLGDDDPKYVEENRRRLGALLPRPATWLRMVHGTTVIHAESVGVDERPIGDAMVAHAPEYPCVVSTADCLPVFLCARDGTAVGVAHAGWRGLAEGVIEATVEQMRAPMGDILAHLGPAIGPASFEVGGDVFDAFVSKCAEDAPAFVPRADVPGKYYADLYQLARRRLHGLGITEISGGTECTFRQAERYFSYRREKISGRMASVIWLAEDS